MRLDHLLSKEPRLLVPALGGDGCGVVWFVDALMVPWLFSGCLVSTACRWVGVESWVVRGWLGVGRAVGFWGFRRVVGVSGRVRVRAAVGWFRVWAGWLVEFCIVDASIFCSCVDFVGGKLLRAVGGCLGIKSR